MATPPPRPSAQPRAIMIGAARIDRRLWLQLKALLVQQEVTVQEWLTMQVSQYLARSAVPMPPRRDQ